MSIWGMPKREVSICIEIAPPDNVIDDFIQSENKFIVELCLYLTRYKDIKDKLRKYGLTVSVDGGNISLPDAFNVRYVKYPIDFNEYAAYVNLIHRGHLVGSFRHYDIKNGAGMTTHGILCMIIEAINNITKICNAEEQVNGQ